MRKFLGTLCFALLFYCILPLLTACDGAPPVNSPFAATGLLTQPNETAEEIVYRAHFLDQDAIALAVAGYALETGGFPDHALVAESWAKIAARTGTAEDSAYLCTLSHFWMDDAEDVVMLLAECDLGLTSPYADIFAKAGIFDIQARRSELLALAGAESQASGAYKKRQAEMLRQAEEVKEAALLVRALVNRPATPEELERLNRWLRRDWYAAVFFAATANDSKAVGKLRWQAGSLLKFVSARYLDPDAGRSTAANPATFWLPVSTLLNGDSAPALDLLRRAHAGNMSARRTLAHNYTSITAMGFIPEPDLFSSWLMENCAEGDINSMLQAAAYIYQQDDVSLAWSMASRAADLAGENDRELAEGLMKLLEADKRFNAEEALAYKQDKLGYHKK